MSTERLTAPVASVIVLTHLQGLADVDDLDWWIGTEWVAGSSVVVVNRVGGARKSLVVDQPRMLVECYADTKANAEDLGQVVEAMVAQLNGAVVDDFQVYKVEWSSGPVFYPDAQHRPRVQMLFSFDVRVK